MMSARRFVILTTWLVAGLWVVPGRSGGETAPAARMDVHYGLSAAVEAASKDGQLVLVIFNAKWCEYCQELQRRMFATPDFENRVGALHIVHIDVDADQKQARAFKVDAIPDLVLMSAEQKIVARRKGLLEVEALLEWIEAGRKRLAAGLWEGIAADKDLAEAVEGAGDPDTLRAMVRLLGSRDPADRERVSAGLAAAAEQAVPFLIEGLEDPYLGVRIGAAEVLRKMAPDVPVLDPWAVPADRQQQVAAVRQWWGKTGELPPPHEGREPDAQEKRAIEAAIEGVLSAEAVRRTDGMSTLVRTGRRALPSVRAAIAKCAQAGDQKTVWVLEDVRWAILVPDGVEAAIHVRRDLARGTSEQRQEAAVRLSRGAGLSLPRGAPMARGGLVMPALCELIDDADPLVKESAAQTLGKIGGAEALDAMAVLLKSEDSSLRTITAQTLGQSKNKAAAAHLAAAVSDPDEAVACVAIAALEEIKAKDQDEALIRCLSDERWRVRAAAAEAVGKLEIKNAAEPLGKLLEDTDPFVVRSAAIALRQIKVPLPLQDLISLAERQPSLTGMAVEIIMEQETAATLKTLEGLYDKSDAAVRMDILSALLKHSNDSQSDDSHWQPLLEKAVSSDDPHIRQMGAAVLGSRSCKLATGFIERLLADADSEVRTTVAGLVLQVAGHHWGVSYENAGIDFGALAVLEAEESGAKPEASSGSAASRAVGTLSAGARKVRTGSGAKDSKSGQSQIVRARELKALHVRWHELLKPQVTDDADLRIVLAAYVTGDGRTDLPVLEKALGRQKLAEEVHRLVGGRTVALLLKRVPWPEAESLIDRAARTPVLYAAMLDSLKYASAAVGDFLLDSDRVVGMLESAKGDELRVVLQELLGQPESFQASLYISAPRNAATLKRLCESANPVARAVGVFVLTTREGPGDLDVAERALRDENPWVRRAAVQGVWTMVKDPVRREAMLGPFLSDADQNVVAVAAVAILDDALRSAADLDQTQNLFQFEDIGVWHSYSSRSTGDRPITTIDRKPEFLDVLRKRPAGSEKSAPVKAPFS